MTSWTRKRIDDRLGTGLTVGSKVMAQAQIIDDLLAERDDLAAMNANQRKTIESLESSLGMDAADGASYRLPDWLGGHAVEIVDELTGMGFPAVTVRIPGEADERMVVARGWLVELPAPCTCPDHMRDHR